MSDDTPMQPGVYALPVSALLTLGKPTERTFAEWPDYVGTHAFTPEHIPELSRLFADETYWEPEYQKRPEAYAFVHALRALGQLRDEAALKFLIHVAETEMESDWVWEEIPYAIALFGPSIIPQLRESLERTRTVSTTGMTIIASLEKIVELYPEAREQSVAVLTDVLEKAADSDEGVNGSIIATLIDLKALEALPVIERAFATDNVDLMMAGDWDDVQVEFGLKEPDPNKPRYMSPLLQELGAAMDHMRKTERSIQSVSKRKAEAKKKAKRKQAKKDRRRTKKGK